MTTAHRPTFVSRKGNNIYTDIPTLQFSVKDLPSQTILKLRFNEKDGRYYNDSDFLKPKNSEEERKRMIKELKKREREEKKKKLKEEENELLLGIHKRKKISEKETQKIKIEPKKDKNLKKMQKNSENEENSEKEENEEKSEKVEKSEKSEENNEDEEKDSEEELMRELEKIKKEQEEENKKKNEEIKEKLEKEMISLQEKNETNDNNSFINSSFDFYNNNYSSYSLSKRPEEFSLKKKWYEDTVFRNQSRKEEKIKKRFINDNVHSDFHYIFLDKAIQ